MSDILKKYNKSNLEFNESYNKLIDHISKSGDDELKGLFLDYQEKRNLRNSLNIELLKEKIGNKKLNVNQKVKSIFSNSYYWIEEINDKQVLLRTTENVKDPNYDDFWVDKNKIKIKDNIITIEI